MQHRVCVTVPATKPTVQTMVCHSAQSISLAAASLEKAAVSYSPALPTRRQHRLRPQGGATGPHQIFSGRRIDVHAGDNEAPVNGINST